MYSKDELLSKDASELEVIATNLGADYKTDFSQEDMIYAILDKQAEDMFSRLAKQMAECEGVTEKLKADDQMEWVDRMNNIRSRAKEVINNELIFS